VFCVVMLFNFNKRNIIRWLLGNISDQMRSPTNGLRGWLAMKIMETNALSTREAIRRLKLSQQDVFVELGTGHGDSVRKIAEMDNASIPKRIVCVEISNKFRTELRKTIAELPKELPIEIHGKDCIEMPYLDDCSTTKLFGMNLVYFLIPFPEYLKEINRVLVHRGEVVFGCKFGVIPENNNEEFVNTNEFSIVEAMTEVGFDVTTELVKVGENGSGNYVEIKGIKR